MHVFVVEVYLHVRFFDVIELFIDILHFES